MRRKATIVAAACLLTSARASAGPPGPPAPPPVAPAPATALSPDEQALFTWWDGLGYPDLAKARFVRALTGYWEGWGRKEPVAVAEHAFLLEDDGERFRLFSTELTRTWYARTGPEAKAHERVGYEDVDLAAFVSAGVAAMEAVPGPISWSDVGPFREKPLPDPFSVHRYATPNQSYRMLVLARACSARGRPDLAHRLCALALREQDRRDGPGLAADDGPFGSLKDAMATDAHRALVLAVTDPRVTLAEVAQGYRRLATGFPADALATGAARDAEAIEATLAAESARAGAARPPEDAPVDARVDDLIARLRETAGELWSLSDATRRGRDAPLSDAHAALVAIGLQAVPRLVAALDDRGFTRAVVRHETGHGQWRESYTPYRVRDAAVDVLDEIAGGAFRDADAYAWSLHPSEDEGWPAVRERVVAWADESRTTSQAEILSRVVAAGDGRAGHAARRLASAHPAEAIGALRRGIEAAPRPFEAQPLVAALGEVPLDAAVDALLEILRDDRRLRVRLAAARALLPRGRRDGVPPMIEAWRHPAAPEMQKVAPDLSLPADPALGGDLLRFLVESGDAQAYRAIRDAIADAGVGLRFHVVSSFVHREKGDRPLSKDAATALEDLLALSLEDTDEVEGTSMSVGGVRVDARIGLVAAWALASEFSDVYRFDPKAAPKAKEAQRRASVDAWRSRRGLPPLPPPVEKSGPPRTTASEAAPLLSAYFDAPDSGRSAAAAAIESRGVAILPALLDRLRSAGAEHPARTDAEALARRLASTVTEVRLDPRSVRPDEGFTALLRETKGKPFGRDRFLALVLRTTQHMPDGATGLRLRADRADDLAGVTLTIELTSALAGPNGSGGGWEHHGPEVSIGGEGRGVSYGTGAFDYGQTPEGWKDEADDVEEAFATTAPDVPVVVRFSVVRERLAEK